MYTLSYLTIYLYINTYTYTYNILHTLHVCTYIQIHTHKYIHMDIWTYIPDTAKRATKKNSKIKTSKIGPRHWKICLRILSEIHTHAYIRTCSVRVPKILYGVGCPQGFKISWVEKLRCFRGFIFLWHTYSNEEFIYIMNSCSNHLAIFCGQEDPRNPQKFKPHKNYQPYNITYTQMHIYCTLIYKDMYIYNM